ncbi:MAG: DUF4268 domain-containing protein [Bacteroidetes bacterium]|jgi:hypothetical protein|nr:DUF4268 domain-containing protein [Bacteroidota bacterium]
MYRISKSTNSVTKLEQRLFKDLKIRERENLQEWIANNPDMLGEELLIIQKEFDGFNDTHERLDLLALDKDGGLVIIENKLDDTGRNVVWQALKYTSYCSTLTSNQILKMYQEYLNKYGEGGEAARENIVEFLGWEEDDLLLNRNDQRIIFVSNNYRKEVTSTVLWLLNHDIQIQCFRATPYSMGEEMFLQMEQIIPLPETKEFMIDAKEKEKEEKSKSKTVSETEARLVEFWSMLKDDLTKHNIDYLENIKARPSFYINFRKENGVFAYSIGKYTLRVELYFPHDSDKIIIDTMKKYQAEIESGMEKFIHFERLDDKKASRIKYELPIDEYKTMDVKFSEKANWELWIDWYRDAMVTFYNRIYPVWEKVQKELK